MQMTIRIIPLLFLFSFMSAGACPAHKINVFAYAEAGEVKVESYFADGRPVKQSRVTVYDSSGTLLLKGKTDSEGRFGFPVPKLDDLEIVVHEILGHRNSYTLEKTEIEAAQTTSKGGR